MEQLHNLLTLEESLNLIEAHFNLTRNETAKILGISRQWLHYSMNERMSKRVRKNLMQFILLSYENWDDELFWREALETYGEL